MLLFPRRNNRKIFSVASIPGNGGKRTLFSGIFEIAASHGIFKKEFGSVNLDGGIIMHTKTMEGLAGASMNMKMLNTPFRVYKEAKRMPLRRNL